MIITMARVNVNIFSAVTSLVMQRLQGFEYASSQPRKGQI